MEEKRIIDANINRSAEGLRVLEDIARFVFNDKALSASLRQVRHKVRELFKGRERDLLVSRDSASDVGAQTSQATTSDMRSDIKDAVLSNFKRVQEAVRSIEECLKILGEYNRGKEMEALRFHVYSLEPKMISLFTRALPQGIYGILGEKFSCGRTNVQVAKEMADAGIDLIQYREKLTDKSIKDIYEECKEIRKITKSADIPFIVNDYADIALMVGADGIHQGQDDLPIPALRAIAGDMMLGCSTHSPEQAKKAIEDGADYIGVGPIFSTQTKEDVVDPVGFEYLEYVAENHTIPFVAIGGIKRHHLGDVLRRGAKTVCLVTEIIGADNIQARIKEIKDIMGRE
ncbi:MAG: thiamine phosphate synthase [Desulfobacteraceae bacterium]|nr:thiamine phosphate synthase [Desulfobacteraceae bacterium]